MTWTVNVNGGGDGDPWPGNRWIPIAPNVVVPARFSAEGWIDGFKVSMVIESDFGVPECVHLSVQAANALEMLEAEERGEHLPMKVTGEVLRKIPVNYLVKESVRLAMAETDEAHALTFSPVGQPIPPAVMSEWPKGNVDVVLQWVASTYRRAAAVGDPPNVAVQKATGWSRATANRALKMAREKGILGEDEKSFSFGGPPVKLRITEPTGPVKYIDLSLDRREGFVEFGYDDSDDSFNEYHVAGEEPSDG